MLYFLSASWYLSLISCDPMAPESTYTIEGYLFEDCSMTPYAQMDIKLFQEYSSTNNTSKDGGEIAYATTDSVGHFKMNYKSENDYKIEILFDH